MNQYLIIQNRKKQQVFCSRKATDESLFELEATPAAFFIWRFTYESFPCL